MERGFRFKPEQRIHVILMLLGPSLPVPPPLNSGATYDSPNGQTREASPVVILPVYHTSPLHLLVLGGYFRRLCRTLTNLVHNILHCFNTSLLSGEVLLHAFLIPFSLC